MNGPENYPAITPQLVPPRPLTKKDCYRTNGYHEFEDAQIPRMYPNQGRIHLIT